MPSVRLAFLLSGVLSAASCRADAPLDCAKANRDFLDCVDSNPAVLAQARWDLCIPHSESLLLTGVWVTDFEWNQFHEDGGKPPKGSELSDYKRYIYILPELYGRALTDDVDTGDGAAIVRIRFIGRRPLCKAMLGPESIIVDRVLSSETLETGPVNSITYGPDAGVGR